MDWCGQRLDDQGAVSPQLITELFHGSRDRRSWKRGVGVQIFGSSLEDILPPLCCPFFDGCCKEPSCNATVCPSKALWVSQHGETLLQFYSLEERALLSSNWDRR